MKCICYTVYWYIAAFHQFHGISMWRFEIMKVEPTIQIQMRYFHQVPGKVKTFVIQIEWVKKRIKQKKIWQFFVILFGWWTVTLFKSDISAIQWSPMIGDIKVTAFSITSLIWGDAYPPCQDGIFACTRVGNFLSRQKDVIPGERRARNNWEGCASQSWCLKSGLISSISSCKILTVSLAMFSWIPVWCRNYWFSITGLVT